jgi:hypothetical protein
MREIEQNLCGSPKACQRTDTSGGISSQISDGKVGAVVSKILTSQLALSVRGTGGWFSVDKIGVGEKQPGSNLS